MSQEKILILVGPTGSGKTKVAYEISRHIPCEMISCDSMQVYRSMPVTTQAPSRQKTRRFKTHLVSFIDPSREYNAALFRRDASLLIQKILKKGKTPFLVGGTGLYLRALLDGLFEAGGDLKPKDEVLRKELLEAQARHGGNYLHEELRKVDLLSAERIHPNDHRRLVRALEVFRLTQKPFSQQKNNKTGLRDRYDCRIFLLDRERTDLYERINRRVHHMLKEGLVAEIKRLERRNLSQTARMALGVREIKGYLDGQYSLKEATELLKKNTRNYAKRQLSWFRHEREVENIPVAAEDTAKVIASRILDRFQ